ncbi:MAG: glycosyltransferase family 4 protein [Sulfurospirillum sp.]
MIYFTLFLLSFILTYVIKNIALKKSMFDIPNERSSHSVPIPHGGGIALALTWFIGLIYLYMHDLIQKDLFLALFFGIIISFVSFLDDIYKLSPKIRLFVQFFVSGCALYISGGLSKIDFGFYAIDNQIFTNIFAIFMMVWFINLYNFLDGIDGYAGSEAIFLGLAGYLLFSNAVFLVLIAAVGGFLLWNWQKAKIFMGDVGSTLLGYNVAVFTLFYQNNGTSFLVWMILFSLFWFDATLTLYRRYKNGEKLSLAHKKHAYQRLNQSGWSHQKVVMYSILLNLILLIFAFFAKKYQNLSLIMLLMAIIMLCAVMKNIDKRKKFI